MLSFANEGRPESRGCLRAPRVFARVCSPANAPRSRAACRHSRGTAGACCAGPPGRTEPRERASLCGTHGRGRGAPGSCSRADESETAARSRVPARQRRLSFRSTKSARGEQCVSTDGRATGCAGVTDA